MEKNQERFTHKVPSFEKLDFVRWVTKQHEMIYREGKWLLNFLLVNPLLIQKLEFVINADLYKEKEALVLTAHRKATKEELLALYDRGFLYYKDNEIIRDIQGIIQHIEEATDPIYVEINYQGYETDSHYIEILSKQEEELGEKGQNEVEALLEHVQGIHHMNVLLKEIDASLINGDRDAFFKLTKQLNKNQS